MANEINGVIKWMYARLLESSIIRDYVGIHPTKKVVNVYEMVAAAGALPPFITIVYMSGAYRNSSEGRKVFGRLFFQVRVYCPGETFDPLEAVTNEIEARLSQQIQLTEKTVLGCVATRPVQGVEDVEGQRRNYLGTEFEVFAYSQPG